MWIGTIGKIEAADFLFLLPWKLHIALGARFEAQRHGAIVAIVLAAEVSATQVASPTVFVERTRILVVVDGTARQIEGGIATGIVGIHLHDQGLVLHIDGQAAARLAVDFGGNHPGTGLRGECVCHSSCGQQAQCSPFLEHVFS
ncbi:hypothetical protein D3C72_2058830 [compost metagenome]